jgi:hypothetical protein
MHPCLPCRWRLWLHRLSDDLRLERPYDAEAWHAEVMRFTLAWTSGGGASPPLHPTGDAVQTALALCIKWGVCGDVMKLGPLAADIGLDTE